MNSQNEDWWRAACDRWDATAGPEDAELLRQLKQQQQGGEQLQPPEQQQQQQQRLLMLQWRLLQAASWEDAEGFWPAVLRALGIRFAVPPTRYGSVRHVHKRNGTALYDTPTQSRRHDESALAGLPATTLRHLPHQSCVGCFAWELLLTSLVITSLVITSLPAVKKVMIDGNLCRQESSTD